jgi:hypothetical protein
MAIDSAKDIRGMAGVEVTVPTLQDEDPEKPFGGFDGLTASGLSALPSSRCGSGPSGSGEFAGWLS